MVIQIMHNYYYYIISAIMQSKINECVCENLCHHQYKIIFYESNRIESIEKEILFIITIMLLIIKTYGNKIVIINT